MTLLGIFFVNVNFVKIRIKNFFGFYSKNCLGKICAINSSKILWKVLKKYFEEILFLRAFGGVG